MCVSVIRGGGAVIVQPSLFHSAFNKFNLDRMTTAKRLKVNGTQHIHARTHARTHLANTTATTTTTTTTNVYHEHRQCNLDEQLILKMQQWIDPIGCCARKLLRSLPVLSRTFWVRQPGLIYISESRL
jgi:hypothetical protein